MAVVGRQKVTAEWVQCKVLWCDLFGEVVADAFVVSRVWVNALDVY